MAGAEVGGRMHVVIDVDVDTGDCDASPNTQCCDMQDSGESASLAADEVDWRGSAMATIYGGAQPFQLAHVPPVQPSALHAVLYSFPIREPPHRPPRRLKAQPRWDTLHVRLPCSPKNQYPITDDDGSQRIVSRWEMIENALLRPISNSVELEAAILSYNSRYQKIWTFPALHTLFEEALDDSETRVFFEDLLPRIVRFALRLPELVQAPIPLLKQDHNQSVTLSQEQIACLLANAFLCTFPRRNSHKANSEYYNFPEINFNRLYKSRGNSVLEKIKCICHYFRRVCPTAQSDNNVPTGVVTFTRRSLLPAELPVWSECSLPMGATPLHISSTGTIEDQGQGLLQVDFANRFMGGGVLGGGCVQEEIRFVICPELLVSKLFTEALKPTEALIITGCERYSNYTGYANSFEWAGNHEDCTPYDSSRRRKTHIVAIDALRFTNTQHQYRVDHMLRELNKAYTGFLHPLATPAPGVASGNWGCGAFGGEASLKAMLQLMACTLTCRPLVYYTFGNVKLRDDVYAMHSYLREHGVLVKELWEILCRFRATSLLPNELYTFIYCSLKCKQVVKKIAPTPPLCKTNSKGGCCSADSVSEEPPIRQPALPTALRSPDGEESSQSSEHGDDEDNDDDDVNDADDMALKATKYVPPATTNTATSASAPTQTHSMAASGSRQRTLLEMLDRCYTDEGSHSASKRHCHNWQKDK